MARRTWLRDVDGLLAAQERVATHAQLVSAGMPVSTLTARVGVRGPWQRLLPGVVLAHRGTATRRERLLGAQLYAGPSSVITGAAALRQRGVRAVQRSSLVHVLVPHGRQRQNHGFVVVERTRHLPEVAEVQGLRVAPVPRAAADACRREEELSLVRELVAEVVQRRMTTVAELVSAVRAAHRARTGQARLALAEVAAGVRSVAEARAREAYARAGVPMPLWNAELLEDDGSAWAVPDGLWVDLAAVLLVDSMAWHLRPAAYQRSQAQQRRYGERSVLVLPVAPSLVIDDEAEFLRATRAFLREAERRHVRPALRVRPARAA